MKLTTLCDFNTEQTYLKVNVVKISFSPNYI